MHKKGAFTITTSCFARVRYSKRGTVSIGDNQVIYCGGDIQSNVSAEGQCIRSINFLHGRVWGRGCNFHPLEVSYPDVLCAEEFSRFPRSELVRSGGSMCVQVVFPI